MEPNTSLQNHPALQYCMLIIEGRFLSSKKKVYVDFGDQNDEIIPSNYAVITEAAKVRDFITIIDALNYMASIGWEVVHLTPFETDQDGGTFENFRYLMKRSR
jgi:hypothetical protein